jgi:cytochrome c-type biogenesis protein CcmH
LKALAALFAAFLLAAQLAPGPVWAAGAQPEEQSTFVPPLADPVLEARAKALQKELRCLVCQGQSIDESNAALATDLRRLIRQQIQSGQSDNDIKSFLSLVRPCHAGADRSWGDRRYCSAFAPAPRK